MGRPHEMLLTLAAGRPSTRSAHPDEGGRELVRSAFEHHLFGLLWSAVRRGDIVLGHDVESGLAVQVLMTRSRHEQLWATIADISARLNGSGIEFAVMKGLPAEDRWYAARGERPCADVDVLVAPGDIDRLPELVGALDPEYSLRPTILDEYQRGLVHGLDLEMDGVTVDIHLDAVKIGPLGRGSDAMWDHTELHATPTGGSVRVLDAEASLFHFLLTLNKDGFCRLLGYADVARILDRASIDWNAFRDLADSYGLDTVVHSSLEAVTSTLALPSRAAVAPRPRGRVRARAWRLLWPPAVRLQGQMGWVRHRRRVWWLPLLATGHLRETVRWWLGRVLLTPALVAHGNPGVRGPWFWRLLVGRAHRWRVRRRRVASLRSEDGRLLSKPPWPT